MLNPTTEAATSTPLAQAAAPAPAAAKAPKNRSTAKKAAAPKKAKAAKPAAPKKAAAPKKGGDAKTKTAIVATLLQRPAGCTGKEILAATSWPTVSVPQQAKAAGLKLRKVKEKGKPTVYFGTPKG